MAGGVGTRYELDVELTLAGPILTRGGQMTEPGVDAPVARDGMGRVMLPYSLVKGKVREALRDLGETDLLKLFGLGSGDANEEGAPLEPDRGQLRFSDFVTEERRRSPVSPNDGSGSGDELRLIERIEIDRETGTAKGAMLAMLEAPFGYGEEVLFKGKVEFLANGEVEAAEIQTKLAKGFRWVRSYGALRTVGFGRTVNAKASAPRGVQGRSEGTPKLSGARLAFRLRLDRPLCVVGRKHSGNHFDSETEISGAVLKGAVASHIVESTGALKSGAPARMVVDEKCRFPLLGKYFEVIRFSEARPVRVTDDEGQADRNARRAVVPPLSVVTIGSGDSLRLRDVARIDPNASDDACLIEAEVPTFQADWKGHDYGLAAAVFGIPDLPKERRVRTAIEEETGRAKENNLFSYGLVLPEASFERKGREVTDIYEWDGEIGLEAVPAEERNQVVRELQDALAQGIAGIGKTRANATVCWFPERASPAHRSRTVVSQPEALHFVTLQTEAMLTPAESFLGPKELRAAYAEYFNAVSKGSLELVRFFAKQELRGGFLAKRAERGAYEPFPLTSRGSVFVLRETGTGDAPKVLEDWLLRGLPNANWIATKYGEPGQTEASAAWRRCPFLRENGYGEVAVDLECHSLDVIASSAAKG